MSTEQNKAFVRSMVEEIFNRGNIGDADQFLASDFVEPDAAAWRNPRALRNRHS